MLKTLRRFRRNVHYYCRRQSHDEREPLLGLVQAADFRVFRREEQRRKPLCQDGNLLDEDDAVFCVQHERRLHFLVALGWWEGNIGVKNSFLSRAIFLCFLSTYDKSNHNTPVTHNRWHFHLVLHRPSSFCRPTQGCVYKAPTFQSKTKVTKCRWWIAVKTTNTRSGFSFQLSGIDWIPYRFLLLLPLPMDFISFINFLCGGEVRKKLQKAVIKNYIIEKKIETILWNFMTFSSSVRVVLDVFFCVLLFPSPSNVFCNKKWLWKFENAFFATLFVLENHSVIRFYRWFHASRDAVKLPSDELQRRENRKKKTSEFSLLPKSFWFAKFLCWILSIIIVLRYGRKFDVIAYKLWKTFFNGSNPIISYLGPMLWFFFIKNYKNYDSDASCSRF